MVSCQSTDLGREVGGIAGEKVQRVSQEENCCLIFNV